MNRRRFLTWLASGAAAVGAVAAGAELDLERLLWVPGRKTLFDLHSEGNIADVKGFDWHADDSLWAQDRNFYGDVAGNTFITTDWVTREALKILENNLTLQKAFNRRYDDAFDHLAICPKGPILAPIDIEGEKNVEMSYRDAYASAYQEGGHAFLRVDFHPEPARPSLTVNKVKL